MNGVSAILIRDAVVRMVRTLKWVLHEYISLFGDRGINRDLFWLTKVIMFVVPVYSGIMSIIV